jgi:translation elongation factor P/translation initiation factor 5A
MHTPKQLLQPHHKTTCDVRKCSAVPCNKGQAIFVMSFVAMFSGAESEYTAIYSKIQEEPKDTERNRK